MFELGEFACGCRIPEPYEVVITAGSEAKAILAQGHLIDGLVVDIENAHGLALSLGHEALEKVPFPVP